MADLNHPLQHDISLKRLALTSLIIYIYKDPVIMTKMKGKAFTKYKKRSSFPFKALKCEIIKFASKKLQIMGLPKRLLPEAEFMIMMLGKKLVSWVEHIVRLLELDMSYLDEIFWTSIGTIDDAKIYNEYWRKHGNFNKILKNNAENYAFASKMACLYGNEKAILSHQTAMIEEVQNYLRQVNLPDIKNKVEQLAATYLTFLYREGHANGIVNDDMMKEKEKDIHQRFQQTGRVSISDAIFVCDTKAIKFLWKFLKKSEKEEIVFEVARENLERGLLRSGLNPEWVNLGYGSYDEETEMVVLANASETVLFLINEMSTEQKHKFLREHGSGVLQLLMQVWPYQEICLKLLDMEVVADSVSHEGEDLLIILFALLIKIQRDANLFLPELSFCENVFHKILRKAFSIISKKTKKHVLFNVFYFAQWETWGLPTAINKFYEIFDVNALGIIINDPDLKNKSMLIKAMGSFYVGTQIKEGKLKAMLNYIEKVLIDKDDRKSFITNWNLQNHPEVGNDDNFRQKILDWLND